MKLLNGYFGHCQVLIDNNNMETSRTPFLSPRDFPNVNNGDPQQLYAMKFFPLKPEDILYIPSMIGI